MLKERVSVCIAFLVILITSYMLIKDIDLFFINSISRQTNSVQLATLEQKNNIVKRMPKNLPVWENVATNDPLFENEQIYTAMNSAAKILFKDGSTLDVDENSLIIIKQTQNMARIHLIRGGLFGSSKGKIEVVSNLGTTKFEDNSKASIRISGQTQKIDVAEGKVAIQTQKNETSEIKKNQSQEITPLSISEIKQIELELVYPESSQKIYIPHAKTAQKFEWINKNNEPVVVEISRDHDFKSIYYSREARSNNLTIEIEEGVYYWRIRKNNSVSPTYKFVSIRDYPPKLIKPYQKEIVSYLRKPIVVFDWEKDLESESYKIIVALDDKFTKPVIEKDAVVPPFSTAAISDGTYFWKTQKNSKRLSNTLWSETNSFSVYLIKVPSIIELKPEKGAKFLAQKDSIVVNLAWKESDKSKGYRLEISDSINFNNILLAENTLKNTYAYSPKNIGKHYWRVKPFDYYDRNTDFTLHSEFDVMPSELKQHRPADEQEFKYNIENNKIVFSWNKNIVDNYYLLEISAGSNFNQPILINSKNNYFVWEYKAHGNFYWRVSSYDASNKKISTSETKTFKISTPEEPKTPIEGE